MRTDVSPSVVTLNLDSQSPHLLYVRHMQAGKTQDFLRRRHVHERETARRVGAVPGAGARHADDEAGQGPPPRGLPRHLRQHRVQPAPPRPLPRPRRSGRPPGLPLRHHPRRHTHVRRRRRRRRHAGPAVPLLLHHDHLPPPPEEPAPRPQRRRPGGAAGELRRGRRRHELLRGRCRGARRAVRALLDCQRLRLHGLPQLPLPPRPGPHPSQRRRASEERAPGHAGDAGARDEQTHAPPGLLVLRPHHGPRRHPLQLPAARGRAGGPRDRRHPQHLRRARADGARRHARRPPPARLHHRPASPPHRAASLERRWRRHACGDALQPLERRPVMSRVAPWQGTAVRGVRQLRERDHHVQAGAGGVRVGAGRLRPRLPVDREERPGEGRCRRAAAGVPRGHQGQVPPGELVRAGGGDAARGGGRLPDALRVELHDGGARRRGADALLALLRRAADQQPLRVRGMGRRGGGRRRRAPGGGRGEDKGGDGRRRGREGDAEEGGGVEGGRLSLDRAARWQVAGQP